MHAAALGPCILSGTLEGKHLVETSPEMVPTCGIGEILTALQASSVKCGGAKRAGWERPGVRMKWAQNGLCQPLLKAGWDHDCRYPPVPSAEPGQHSKTKGWHLLRSPVRDCRAAPGPGSLPSCGGL